MILRRHNGSVIFASYRFLFHCNDALEAHIHALMQGMLLAIEHTDLLVIAQLDSSSAPSVLVSDSLDHSTYCRLSFWRLNHFWLTGSLSHKKYSVLRIE